MISMKELEMTEDLLVDELKKVVKKGELKDGTEAKALKDVLEAIKLIHCLRDGDEMESPENGYSGYSGYSGGWGRTRMPVNYNGNVDFNGTYGRRSPMTGRYISSNGGYSGHSIHDRMIASLEGLYDQAGTQHEKDEISNWIGRLRTEN